MGSYAGGLGTSSSGKRSRDDYSCDDDAETTTKLGVNKVARAATWDSPASAPAADASSSSAAAGYGAVEQAWVSALLAAPPPPSPPPPLLPPSAGGPLNFQQRVMAAAALQEIRGAGGGIQRPPLPRTGTMATSSPFEASPSSFGDSDLVSSIRAPLVLPQNGLHQQQSTGVLSQQGGILGGLLQQGQQQSSGSLHHQQHQQQQQQPVLPLPSVTPLMPPLMARDPVSWFSTGIKDQSPASSSFQDLVMPPFSGIGMSSSLPPPIQQQAQQHTSLPLPPPPPPAPALSSQQQQQACDLLLDHLPMPPSMTAAGYGDSFPSYGGNLLLPSIAGCSSPSSQGRNNYHVAGNTHNSCSNNANNNVGVNSSASKLRQQQQQQYHQHHQLANGSSYCSSEIAVSSITSVHNNNNGGASSSTSMHNGSPDEHHHGHHVQQHQNQNQQQQQQQRSKQAPTRTYTKVYKLGSIGRAVDVTRFNNYTELRWELARMFGLEGQLDPKSGWQLVFIDHEGDILLVGDDPWEEFVTSVRGIRILSPSEVSFYTGNDTSNTGLAAGGSSGGGTGGGGGGVGGGGSGGGGVGPSSHSCLTSGLF